jgi:hypothetical protein
LIDHLAWIYNVPGKVPSDLPQDDESDIKMHSTTQKGYDYTGTSPVGRWTCLESLW